MRNSRSSTLSTAEGRRRVSLSPRAYPRVIHIELGENIVGRSTYWILVPLILAAHVFIYVYAAKGLAPVDNTLVILLAVVLGRRFRDIGWPI
jgi:hypothetical protein